MSLEMKAADAFDNYINSAEEMMTPEVESIIKKSAWIVSIVSFAPIPVIGSMALIFFIWKMYYDVSKEIGLPFSLTSGLIINIISVVALDLVCELLVGIGWIASAIATWFFTYYQGKGYLGVLIEKYKDDKKYMSVFRKRKK